MRANWKTNMKSKGKLEREHSIMAMDKFIQATRDSGYRGTGSAVSELVDNAIQAGASKIAVTIDKEVNQAGITISVRDNGCGMDPFTLRQALRFGGSSRFNDRTGIGRYGMGLPNSSFSQARRVTVYTWRHLQGSRENDRIYTSYLDLDEIARSNMVDVPRPRVAKSPPRQCKGKSGTLVVWERCDRLDSRRTSTIVRRLHYELGRRFRHYLFSSVRLLVNEQPVKAIDPLLVAPHAIYSGASLYGNEIRYEVRADFTRDDAPTGIIKVRFSELPVKHWHYLSNDDKRAIGITKGAGISIVRAGREVDNGWFFMGTKRKENYDDWWRCEVKFDPILDEAFGITHTKQQIRPQGYLLEVLTPDLEATARILNARARNAHKTLAQRLTGSRSEIVATDKEELLAPLPSTANRRAKKIMRVLRRKKLLVPHANRNFEYQILPTKLEELSFFAFALDQKMLALVMNQIHPFFRKIYGPLNEGGPFTVDACRQAIEIMLLAAARSEASESTEAGREFLRRFRSRWSDILATFLND
jgi:hypothetical protein